MPNDIPPSKQALREALVLSEDILRNIELNTLPLANVALQASRLARLLNDFANQKVMEFEASGYPSTPNGMAADIYQLAALAGREFQEKDAKTGAINNYVYRTSIEELEQELKSFELALAAARDPDIAVSSANPNQMVWNPLATNLRETQFDQALLALSGDYHRGAHLYTPTYCAAIMN